ncbi:hypothetical protein [Acuticoccus sp.]|uniref:hypothetical protein n=1 Tax=Acuticoccus sp. TaxID=1904378 RepID=UPI003B5185B3
MVLSEKFAAKGLSLVASTPVEIRGRIWVCLAFEPAGRPMGDMPHLALVAGRRDWPRVDDLGAAVHAELSGGNSVLTRIHSECLLGDAFGSSMCDCGDQMRLSMEEMDARREGLFVYLRQEGRGIGMRAKLDCLALQYGFVGGRHVTHRHTSDEANLAMGFDVDERSFLIAGALIRALDIASVQVITGNPQKTADLAAAGVTVASTLDLWSGSASTRAAEELAEKVARGYTYER